jgi:carbohydrate-selective porin OprB
MRPRRAACAAAVLIAACLAAEEECADKHNQCGEWAEKGECLNNPGFMSKD